MPSLISRLFRLIVLLFALTLSIQAQDAPAISISPQAGPAESAVFDILISGLQPDTEFEVEILFAGAVVFSSGETSDAAGMIPYPVRSTEGDQAGVYTIRALHRGEVVVSAEFELIAAAAGAEDRPELPGIVTVSPETAPFGQIQTIRVSELASDSDYALAITSSETQQTAYRRQLRSNAEGVIEIEVFAEAGDSPGRHEIAVYNGGGQLIASGEFTIEAPARRELSLQLTPAALAAGGTVEIAVAGAAAQDSITAQITTVDGVLIDTALEQASAAGEATLRFATSPNQPAGEYIVAIFIEGEKLATASLTLRAGAPVEEAARISVHPEAGPRGSEHEIRAAGLAAEAEYSLIILDPSGAEALRSARVSDAEGAFSLVLSSTEEDEAGIYTIEVRDETGDLLATTSFEVTAATAETQAQDEEDATEETPAIPFAVATISPQSAPIGSGHRITVRDLQAHENVQINVIFAGASVYRSDKTADASGAITLELFTDAEDKPGNYTVLVERAAGNQPAVILTATAASPAATTVAAADEDRVIAGNLEDGRARIEFEGARGGYALLRVASADFDPAAALLDRDDRQLAFSDDSRGRKDAIIGPLLLPYSGQYALEISAAPLMMAQGAIDGEFSVHISSVRVEPIAFESDQPFSLSAETPARFYSLPVETGDSLTVRVDSGGALDTLLQVVAPDGTEYAFDDDSGSGFDAELSNLVFDSAAEYILVLSSFDEGASGAGALSIARNPAHALEDGETVIHLNDKAIRDLVVFDVQEDESLVLNLEKLAGDVEDLYVTATIDGMEVMAYSTMGVPEHLPLAFVTPMGGRVVVTLEKFGFDDAITLEVSLERP